MVPPDLLGEDASLVQGYPFDPAKARTLLEESGWTAEGDGVRQKAGRPLALTLALGPFPTLQPIAVFLQSQLRDVGMDLEIVERPDYASYGELITSGTGDLYAEEGNQNDANAPLFPAILFYSSSTAEELDYPALFAPGPQFDALLDPALTGDDPAKVRRAVAEAMHQIVDVEAVVIPLAGVRGIYGVDENVSGFVPHPSAINTRWDRVSR
jgi:peptide/nickel transport system substrate-binding protein